MILGGGYVSTSKRLFKIYKENQDFWINRKFSSRRQFYDFFKSNKVPDGISKSPSAVFKDQWKGWGEFLKTGRLSNTEIKFKDFEQTKKIIKENNIESHKEYIKFARSNLKLNLRKNLNVFNQFKNAKFFFNKSFLPLNKLKILAKENNINNITQWKQFARSKRRCPVNIERYCKENGLKNIKSFFYNYSRTQKKRILFLYQCKR